MSTFSKLSNKNQTLSNSRVNIECLLEDGMEKDDEKAIIAGLTKEFKTIPPRYFYDSKGSQLFEEICELPEYYPTRTEASILEQYSKEIATNTGAVEIVELGSGSSTKTQLLLDAYQDLEYPLYYTPIDVSGGILKDSANNLLAKYPTLNVTGKVATYEQALKKLGYSALSTRICVFLGSTIGNFSPKECDRFIELITNSLNTGDYFLLGVDLQKPISILEAAYNDSQGITAAFNLNILHHLNWRFDGNFDSSFFEHQAIYSESENQIEMYLTCTRSHTVKLAALDLIIDFKEGEKILTEISRKFNLQEKSLYLNNKGLKVNATYTDDKDWFGLLLCQK